VDAIVIVGPIVGAIVGAIITVFLFFKQRGYDITDKGINNRNDYQQYPLQNIEDCAQKEQERQQQERQQQERLHGEQIDRLQQQTNMNKTNMNKTIIQANARDGTMNC
jgi:hypothetical protein